MKTPRYRCPHADCNAFYDLQALWTTNAYTHNVFVCGRCSELVAYDLDFGMRLPTVVEQRAALFTHRVVRPKHDMIEGDFLKHGKAPCRELAGRNYRLLGA